MIEGVVVYADSRAALEAQLAGVEEKNAVAVFARVAWEIPDWIAFSRVRSLRRPRADLRAVEVAVPGVRWRHANAVASSDVTLRSAPPASGGFPAVATATRLDTRPLRIEAVACACGGPAAEEAGLMVETLKHFHPEWPVYLLTDAAGLATLRAHEANLPAPWQEVTIEVLSEAEQERLTHAAAGAARPMGDRWPMTWVAAKLETLDRAIQRYRGGVLLADADLIVTRRLPDLEWDADLVLSDHAGSLPDRLPERAGRYNAGMVLVRHGGIVSRWRELFGRGVGGFYEQGALEQLAREFVTDLFPSAWNWGDWRRTEDVNRSGRVPPVIHTHLHADAHRIPNRLAARQGLEATARRAIDDVRRAAKAPKRIAFVHYVKAAGSSWSAMWGQQACPRGGWQELNSFRWLGRAGDWEPGELDLINRGKMAGMVGDRHFVHNHAQQWPEDLVRQWHDEGWEFAALYRDVRDRLVSLYHWNRMKRLIPGPAAGALDIESFITAFLEDPRYSAEISLHPANDCIAHWAPATSEGMSALLQRLTGLEIEPVKVNTSRSPGYAAERQAGRIPDRLAERIESDPRVKAWDAFAADRGL